MKFQDNLSFICTTIRKNSKPIITSRNKKGNPEPAINSSRPIVPYHVHNHADFGKPIINGKSLIYLAISKKMGSL